MGDVFKRSVEDYLFKEFCGIGEFIYFCIVCMWFRLIIVYCFFLYILEFDGKLFGLNLIVLFGFIVFFKNCGIKCGEINILCFVYLYFIGKEFMIVGE